MAVVRDIIDRTGTVANVLCAVHCLIVGLAPSVLTLVGLGVLIGHTAEWVLVGMAVFFGLMAAVLGFRVHHSWGHVWFFVASSIVLIVARFFEETSLARVGTVLAVTGGVMMAAAHFANLRAYRTRGRDAQV